MKVWLLVFCCLFGMVDSAAADERILDFLSDIKVEPDGALLVTENLLVRSEGKQVRTGITRDFSHLYRRRDGRNVAASLDVLSVRRDGRPEHFDIERLRRGLRIETGTPAVVFRPGEYQYVITYRVYRQLRAAGGDDALAWDVTGADWTLPIDHVRARVVLPGELPLDAPRVLAAEGAAPAGEVSEQEPGRAVFVSTRTIEPGQSMTIALGWPAGVVSRPGPLRRAWHYLADHALPCVAGGGAAALLLYYLWAWLAAGGLRRRDRTPRTEPPEGMSAQEMRFVRRKGFDRQVFLVGLMDLLARRSVRVWTKPDGLYLERMSNQTGADGRHDPLLNLVLGRFFANGLNMLRLDGLYRRCYDDAQAGARDMLESAHGPALFDEHFEDARQGFYLWLLATVAVAALAMLRVGTWRDWAAVGIVVPLPAVPLLFAVHDQWRAGATSWFSRLVLIVVALALIVAGVGLLARYADGPDVLLASLMPLATLPLVCAAFRFLRTYTARGRALRGQVDGFRRFLAAPGRFPAPATALDAAARYERYLPHAIALGVDRRWAAAHAARMRGEAQSALIDMHARYGAVHDVLDRPRRIMRGLDRWSARAVMMPRQADGVRASDAEGAER